MKRLQPVIWSKGTLLTPQHLQVQDRFAESALQFRMDALSFRPWGFLQLQFDQEALDAGNLVVAQASGMFPDGLAFEFSIQCPLGCADDLDCARCEAGGVHREPTQPGRA